MWRGVGASAAGLLMLVAVAWAGSERLADPTQAFVEGYDPSGNDFFVNVPERTVLLRIRADLDNDGIADLALSESSTWGNAGGQWLLFRGQADGSYVYWGTLFFSPGSAAVRPLERGVAEITLYVRMSATRGSVQVYRATSQGIVRASERAVDLDQPSDHDHANALLPPTGRLPVEYCKLLEYRRDAATCWRPGLGLR